MNFATVSTLGGYKSHLSLDSKRTLCGRDVAGATGDWDPCKSCANKAVKLTEAETVASTHAEIIASLPQVKAEMQALGTDVPSMGAAPVSLTETGRCCTPTGEHHMRKGACITCGHTDTPEPTYNPGQPVSIYATVTGETEEFEAAHVPNGNPADVDRWTGWAQRNPNWTNVRAVNYTNPATSMLAIASARWDGRHSTPLARWVKPCRSGAVYLTVTDVAEDSTMADLFGGWVEYTVTTQHNPPRKTYEGRDLDAALTAYGEAIAEWDRHYAVEADDRAYAGMETYSHAAAAAAMEPTPTDATPVLTLDMSNGRTVLVKVGEHSMTIRNGSDVRLRAAFWARGLGYRPARGRAVQWHRDGKTVSAPLALV